MQEGLKTQGRSGKVEMLRDQGHLMEVLQRICLRYMISLDLRSTVLIKLLSNSQEQVVIGYLALNSRRKKIRSYQMRIQLVESVIKNIMVIAFRGHIIGLVVARVVTR